MTKKLLLLLPLTVLYAQQNNVDNIFTPPMEEIKQIENNHNFEPPMEDIRQIENDYNFEPPMEEIRQIENDYNFEPPMEEIKQIENDEDKLFLEEIKQIEAEINKQNFEDSKKKINQKYEEYPGEKNIIKLDTEICTQQFSAVQRINPKTNKCENVYLNNGCVISKFNSGKMEESNWKKCIGKQLTTKEILDSRK